MKLLLIEDEKMLSDAIAKGLRKRGYAVDCAYDGEEALYLYSVNCYDLSILDLNLPKLDGLTVLERIRAANEYAKVLILSARDTVADKISGLDAGANDYLTKPFDFDELEARVRGLLRCCYAKRDTVQRRAGITFDTAKREVCANGTPIALTKKELSILEYLMQQDGRVVATEELIEHVWESETDPFSNSFKFHMHSLRKKLAVALGDTELIKTVRGQGYCLADEAKEGGLHD